MIVAEHGTCGWNHGCRPLEESGREEQPKDHSIIFERVSFRYEDTAKDALHQINLKIGEGEHVAFVGPSGGGRLRWQACCNVL